MPPRKVSAASHAPTMRSLPTVAAIQKHIQSHIAGMSYAQRLVSMYVLRNVKHFFFLSASDLAERVGVSQATVVRFCQTIGYQGYADFTETAQACVKREMEAHPAQTSALPAFTNPDQHRGILDTVLGMQFAEMTAFAENYDQQTIDACVEMMLKARNIYVLARMSTRPLGIQFVTMLSKVCTTCHLLPDEAMESGVMLQRMGPGDMLLVFSYPRYAKGTVDITRLAKKSGCTVAAVTDSAASPLVPLADVSLLAPAGVISFIEVFSAPNALAAALVLEYCNRAPRETAALLDRFDSISRQRHTFIS